MASSSARSRCIWSRLPSPTRRSASRTGESVSRTLILGHRFGMGRPFSSAISLRRGIPVSLNQGMAIRTGCQASPNRTVRRNAASLGPPTQIGGWGDWTGRGAVSTSLNEVNFPS